MMRGAMILVAMVLTMSASGGELPQTRPEQLPAMKVRIPQTTVEIEFVKIPAGKVEMQSLKEGGPPRIEAVRSIWIARTETTWDMYEPMLGQMTQALRQKERDLMVGVVEPKNRALLKSWELDAMTGPSRIRPYESLDRGFGTGNQPAIGITFRSARLYCVWLSQQTQKRFRLPSEAEWEYVCRTGGAALRDLPRAELDPIAWHSENSATEDFPEGKPHLVGKKRANAWGVHDMLGNVAEWVDVGDDQESVVKGGNYLTRPDRISSDHRAARSKKWSGRDINDPPSEWYLTDAPFVGFRVVYDDAPGATTRPVAR